MADDRDPYVTDFVQESRTHIATLNDALLRLEESPADQSAIEEVFRSAHTLKGNCGAMGLTEASDLAHALEDLLEAVQAGDLDVTAERMDTVFDAVDALEDVIDDVAATGEPAVRTDLQPTIEALRAPLRDDHDGSESTVETPTDDEVSAVLSAFDPPESDEVDAYLVRLGIADGDRQSVDNGSLVVEALIDAFDLIGTDPERDVIDRGAYDGVIDAVFATAVGETAIAAALEPVDAVEDFEIVTVTGRFDADADADGPASTTDGSAETPSIDDDLTGDVTTEQAQEMSVDELLGEFDELDDLDALVEEVEDADAFDDLGEAGSFADLLDEEPEPTTGAGVEETSPAASTQPESGADDEDSRTAADPTADDETGGAADEDDEMPDDAGAVFEELKDEVEMVGFDELQEELDELEFDEFDDEEEVGMDELLGDDVDADDPEFLTVEADETGADLDELVDGETDELDDELVDGETDELDDELVDGETDELDDQAAIGADGLEGGTEADPVEDQEPFDTPADGSPEEPVVEGIDDADQTDQAAAATDQTDQATVDVDDGPVDDDVPDPEPAEAAGSSDVEEPDATEPTDAVETTDELDDLPGVEEPEIDEALADSLDAELGDEPDDELDDEETVDVDPVDEPATDDRDEQAATAAAEEWADTDAEARLDADADDWTNPETEEWDDSTKDDAHAEDRADAGADDDDDWADAGADDDDDWADAGADDDDDWVDVGGDDGWAEPESEDQWPPESVDVSDVDTEDLDDVDAEWSAEEVDELGAPVDEEFAEATAEVDDVFDEAFSGEGTDVNTGADAFPDPGDEGFDPTASIESDEIGDEFGTSEQDGESGPDSLVDRLPDLAVPDLDLTDRPELDAEAGSDDASRPTAVRVDEEQIDTLLTLVEGLVTSRVRLRHVVDAEADHDVIASELDDLRDITTELQETVMDVRLVPLQTVTNRLPRIVRDIAREQEKAVDFEQSGVDVELDRGILDRIGDPLIHLVRNAVDHGIEAPEARESTGKPETGSVTVTAERDRDRVRISIADDGQGLDPDRIREAAVDAEVLDEAEARSLSDEAALDLVFHPGLSTADEVTDVSGRGVGMDVVRRTIEELNGTVSIESEPGDGTTVTMELPVSVAIADVLFLERGGEEFGVPVEIVNDVVAAEHVAREGDGRHAVAGVRGGTGIGFGDGTTAGSGAVATNPTQVDGSMADETAVDAAADDEHEANNGETGSHGGTSDDDASDESVASDEQLPVVDLAEALSTDADGDVTTDGMVVRIREDVRPVALHCDEVRGRQEVVVTPYEGFMGDIPGLSGATVRGRGEVVNILDVTTL